jgi:multidrug transporter EmrE-like cation transporter
MKINIMLVVTIILITITEAIGQYILRLGFNGNGTLIPIPIKYYPLITWGLYGVCTYILYQSYYYTTMGKAEVYWDAASALLVPLIGIFAFKDIISFQGWIGIIMIICGTLLLGYYK